MATRAGLGYVPALDGIRAVAVLLVMLHHAHVPGFDGGGLVGVETFFVLSGFLITSLLVDEHAVTGTIRLGSFYARRALRLLPPLVVVVAVVATYAAVIGETHTVGSAPSVLLYVANWVQATGRPFGLFTHTWSLAVEEQFYVLWPLVLVVLFRWSVSRRTLLLVTVALALIGSVVRAGVWLDGAALVRVRGGFDTRAAGLLLGCALAIALSGRVRDLARRWSTPAAAAAGGGLVVLLTVSATRVNVERWGYAWGITLVELAVLFMIAGAVLAPVSLLSRTFALSPLRAVGRISYGLYLWHFPVFLVVRNRYHLGQPATAAMQFALAFALAGASYVVVERPALALKRRFGVSTAGGPPDTSAPARIEPIG